MVRRSILLGLLLVLLTVSAADAATKITIGGPPFSFPASTVVAVGTTVTWQNRSTAPHTTTNNAPLRLWNLSIAAGSAGVASRAFRVAGAFAYVCNFHSEMQGTIRVKIDARPHTGLVTDTFTIQVATVPAPAGFRYVVQRRAPGGAFVAWKTLAVASTTFKSSTPGTWGFRSKLMRVSDGKTSGFSPVATVTIR